MFRILDNSIFQVQQVWNILYCLTIMKYFILPIMKHSVLPDHHEIFYIAYHETFCIAWPSWNILYCLSWNILYCLTIMKYSILPIMKHSVLPDYHETFYLMQMLWLFPHSNDAALEYIVVASLYCVKVFPVVLPEFYTSI